MLHSLDTYLSNEISEKLQIILKNRYIIEEILKDIEPKVAKNFMRAYCGENGREIPIVYTMPQEKITQQGAIYIGLREGEETHPSLGNLEDTYDFKEIGFIKEESTIQATPEKDRLYLEVSEKIGELYNVEGLSFAASDNVKIEGNRITFAYDESLVGLTFNVNYIGTSGSNEQGLQKGFTTTEHYSVLVISTNMDTVRCLDLIVKAILIMMRDNPEELNSRLLQKLQFGQIEEVDTGRKSSGGVPELLYGRETIVTYKVSYSLDVPLINKIKEIVVNRRVKLNG